MRLFRKKTGDGKESKYWSFRHSEGGSRLEQSTRKTEKEEARVKAWEIIGKWRNKAIVAKAAKEAGIKLPSERSEKELVEDINCYLLSLEAKRRSDQYVVECEEKIMRMIELMDVQSIDQITPERISTALRSEFLSESINAFNEKQLAKPLKNRLSFKRPSTEAIKKYYRSLSSFFNWLIRQDRWDKRNPCIPVDLPSHQAVFERRALKAREIGYLLNKAPRYRGLVYLVAATTGLRRNELSTLRWEDIDLEEKSVLVRAENAKNSRSSVLPLVKECLAEWAAYRKDIKPFYPSNIGGGAGKRGQIRIEQGLALPPIPSANTLRNDCNACGIKWDWDRSRIDFHSLRVSFVTGLGDVGTSLTKAQKLARHSSPDITANIYTKHDFKDLSKEVGKLGRKIGRRRA